MEISGGRLCSRAQRVPYSTLLFWRERRPVAGSWHLFGSPLLVSREGRLVLIRMAQHTANAGLIYSPCGSLDEADITGGRVDIDGNMRREVMEETGLDLAAARAEAGYGVVRTGGVVVVARRFFFDLPAERMVAQARAHMEAEAVSEIDDVFSIGGPEEATARYQFFMPHLLRWHFGAKQ
jgi:8-oxo-dGTP pyrophosphatase MutT (NUDIX family)